MLLLLSYMFYLFIRLILFLSSSSLLILPSVVLISLSPTMMSLQCCRHNLARLTKTFIPLQFHKPPIAFLSTTPTKKEPSPTPETPQVNPQPEEESSTSQSPPETHDKPDELSVLYDAVLAQVPQHGWTDHAISAAVTELGWSPAAKRMIARGPVQVAEQFGIRCNRRLADRLEVETKKGPAAAGGTDPVGRATFAIRDRLEMIEPYHATWRQALALQAAPRNVQKSLYNSSLLADEIAHYSGYTTPDVRLLTCFLFSHFVTNISPSFFFFPSRLSSSLGIPIVPFLVLLIMLRNFTGSLTSRRAEFRPGVSWRTV